MWINQILRDPGGDGGAGGAGGVVEQAKIVIEGDVSKGIANWTEVFPPEIRTVKDKDQKDVPNPILAKYKNPTELIKGIENMQELIGKKGVILPTKDSKPEEVQAFYNALGRPEKPEGYTFTKLEGLHQAIVVTPEAENGWRQAAHQFGLPSQTADALNQWWLKVNDAAVRQMEAAAAKAKTDGETALRAQWKENYDANYAAAKKAMEYFGGKNILEKLGNLGSDPEVVAMFHNIGTKITMDGEHFNGGAGGGGGEVKNVEQAKSRLAEINTQINDPKSPLMDINHKDHQAIVDERTNLYKIIHPEN